MKTIFKEDLTKEKKSIPYLEVEGKRIYYKEVVHPIDFIKLYKKEKPIYALTSKVTTQTDRPFFTFPAKNRKLANIKEETILLIRICKNNSEAEFITKVYKWGKIHVPRNFTNALDIKNHENIKIQILAKNIDIPNFDKRIDLGQIGHYNKNAKVISRTKDTITIYYNRKIPITIPRFIGTSQKLIELIFLIHGDGHYKSKLFFVNKSPELHKFVIKKFENIFRIPKSLWKARILLYNLDYTESAKEYWKNKLNLKDYQFYNTSKSTLKTDKRGNLRIIIDKTLFSLIFRFVFDKIKDNIDKQIALDALNGLLCAEGGAQIDKIGLHKITLSFSQEEKGLFEDILNKAGILNLCKEQQNKMFVIQGWNNLYKFFKIFFSNDKIPFRTHNERRKRALEGFLSHSFTKTMVKYLSVLEKNNNSTLKELSKMMKIREDSILATLRKRQYKDFIKIEGEGINRKPFRISITEEGKEFLGLITKLQEFDMVSR